MRAALLLALALAPGARAAATAMEDLDSAAASLKVSPADNFAIARSLALSRRPPMRVEAPFVLVDLHAHLFMEAGLGLLFTGGFDTPLQARDWKSRFSSQINPATLDSSNLGVVVAALYAHPIMEPDRRGAIRRQVRMARAFVAGHPEWVIAATPAEALSAVRSNRRAIILSLEGAAGILDTEDDLREFIDQAGIRIVTFAHLTDDSLSGAAFMKGYQRLGNPQPAVESAFDPRYGAEGVLVNPHGLTEPGRRMAAALIRRGVWLDLSHATDAAQDQLIPMLKAAGQPLLYTHIALRKYYKAEREMPSCRLGEVRATAGIVGLVPSSEIVGKTLSDEWICRDGVFSLAAQFNEVAAAIGPEHVFIGSDFNGAMRHLAPSNCATGTSLDSERGFYNIGQTSELWVGLRRAGAAADASSFHGAENFISAWSRVHPAP